MQGKGWYKKKYYHLLRMLGHATRLTALHASFSWKSDAREISGAC
jgi:hypothetical protein